MNTNLTFEEEQKHLQNTFSFLALYIHQRKMSRSISEVLPNITSFEINVAMHDLLSLNYEQYQPKMQQMLKKTYEIICSDSKLNQYKEGYFDKSLRIVTESLHCCVCGKDFKAASSKKKYCSEKCRVKKHRLKTKKVTQKKESII